MRDPFRPNTNKQLVREAQFGFTVITLLIAVLIYVAYYRIQGPGDASDFVQDSAVAMQGTSNSHSLKPQFSDVHSVDSVLEPSENRLLAVPKQMLKQSSSTLRKVGTAADSIKHTTSQVQSLASVPVQRNTAGFIGNPATERSTFNPESIGKVSKTNMLTTPSGEKRIWIDGERHAQLLTKGIPTKDPMPAGVIVAPSSLPVSKPKTSPSIKNKPKFHKPSIDFKPLRATPSPKKPEAIESGSFSGIPIPRLTKTPRRSASDSLVSQPPNIEPLRLDSTDKISVANDQNLSSEPKQFKSIPQNIQTVAFRKTTWIVKKGDSFWSIAKSHYGDGRFFRALFQVNRENVPGFEDLIIGVELNLPTTEELVKSHPQFCPPDAVFKSDENSTNIDELAQECDAKLEQCFYRTETGDTLFSIATKELGQASRYVELLELNRFRLVENVTQETQLPTGIRLLLPKK